MAEMGEMESECDGCIGGGIYDVRVFWEKS